MATQDYIIPVIDFEQLGVHRKRDDIDRSTLLDVGGLIKDAFCKIGFCYLKNHGISQEMVDEQMSTSLEFFQQSPEEKAKQARKTENFYGWIDVERLDIEKPADLKEAFNYQPGLDKGNWSTETFRQASKSMFTSCSELSRRICDALSVGFGLGERFMSDAHKNVGQRGNQTALRSLYYPPITVDADVKPGQLRLNEHSDYGTITLLFQDDVGGLEVCSPITGFVPATPIPGTVVVNIGDLMQDGQPTPLWPRDTECAFQRWNLK